MADSSFDIVSKVDKMEADNALHQAQKEIEQRYDFKGVGAEIDWSGEKLLMKASSEERVKAVLDVFQSKLVKRGISLKSLDAGAPFASGKEYRIEGELKNGIDRVTGDYNDFWAARDYKNQLGKWQAATLMAHGFNDWNVMPEQSVSILTDSPSASSA